MIINRENGARLNISMDECVSYSQDGNIVINHGHFSNLEEFVQFVFNWVKAGEKELKNGN